MRRWTVAFSFFIGFTLLKIISAIVDPRAIYLNIPFRPNPGRSEKQVKFLFSLFFVVSQKVL